jgi:hypothetical protein
MTEEVSILIGEKAEEQEEEEEEEEQEEEQATSSSNFSFLSLYHWR